MKKMTEMTTLAYRDTTAENRAIWRSEFTEAFRALHEDYMTRLDEIHMEAESSFAVTVQQQQTTSSKDTFEIQHFSMETQRSTEQINFLNTRIAELTTKVCFSEFLGEGGIAATLLIKIVILALISKEVV